MDNPNSKFISISKYTIAMAMVLTSCTENRKKSNFDELCIPIAELKKNFIREMCTPWDVSRPDALYNLANSITEFHMNYHPEDGDDYAGEMVKEIARSVGPEDCVRAGYPNPGYLQYNSVYAEGNKLSKFERNLHNDSFIRQQYEEDRDRAMKRNGLPFSIFKGGNANTLPPECEWAESFLSP